MNAALSNALHIVVGLALLMPCLYDRATMLTDLTVKLGPVFDLLGILIPLGRGSWLWGR